MREKEIEDKTADCVVGITPACAGKRAFKQPCHDWEKDHPRMCGEKWGNRNKNGKYRGSPPRMRGKAEIGYCVFRHIRITPAYAGKRRNNYHYTNNNWDHPRVCGEKHITQAKKRITDGSPPRMRGKG